MPQITLQLLGTATPLTLDVEWTPASEGLTSFRLTLEGEALTGEASLTSDGGGALRLGFRVLPFYVARTEGEIHLWLAGETYVFTLPPAPENGRRRDQALTATGEIVSPMPGIVLRVLAQPGEAVTAEAPLVILESMKMELTVTAPAEGTVAEVLCQPGTRVDRGAVLLRLESPKEEPAE